MIYALFFYTTTDSYRLEDIWDLSVDAESISGYDFFHQTGRTASLKCENTGWIRENLTTPGWTVDKVNGFYKTRVELWKDNWLIFSGYIKVGTIDIDLDGRNFEEVTIKIQDHMSVLLEWANGMEVELIGGNDYVIIDEIVNQLTAVSVSHPGTLISPIAISNHWQNGYWAPYHYDQMKIWDLADLSWHAYPAENGTNGYNPGHSVDWDQMILFIEAGSVKLFYMGYKWKVYIQTGIINGRQTSIVTVYEQWQQAKYRLSNLDVITEDLMLFPLKVYTSRFFWDTGNQNNDGQTMQQWMDSIVKYWEEWPAPYQPNGLTSITYGVDVYQTVSGTLLFTGNGSYTTVTVADDIKISLLEWVKTLCQIGAVRLSSFGSGIFLKNKFAAVTSNPIQTITDDVYSWKITGEGMADAKVDNDFGMLQNGELIASAINEYYKIMQADYGNGYALRVAGIGYELMDQLHYRGRVFWVTELQRDWLSNECDIKGIGV